MNDSMNRKVATSVVRNVHISHASFAHSSSTFSDPLTLKGQVKEQENLAEKARQILTSCGGQMVADKKKS